MLLELAETLAVTYEDGTPRLNLENRVLDPYNILEVCSSLVTVTDLREEVSNSFEDTERQSFTSMRVRLAHYSVKEYLLSSRISQGPANKYSVNQISSHIMIAETCLTYLLHLNNTST